MGLSHSLGHVAHVCPEPPTSHPSNHSALLSPGSCQAGWCAGAAPGSCGVFIPTWTHLCSEQGWLEGQSWCESSLSAKNFLGLYNLPIPNETHSGIQVPLGFSLLDRLVTLLQHSQRFFHSTFLTQLFRAVSLLSHQSL